MQFFNFFLFSPYELAPPPKLRVVSNLVTLNLAFGFHGKFHGKFHGISFSQGSVILDVLLNPQGLGNRQETALLCLLGQRLWKLVFFSNMNY